MSRRAVGRFGGALRRLGNNKCNECSAENRADSLDLPPTPAASAMGLGRAAVQFAMFMRLEGCAIGWLVAIE